MVFEAETRIVSLGNSKGSRAYKLKAFTYAGLFRSSKDDLSYTALSIIIFKNMPIFISPVGIAEMEQFFFFLHHLALIPASIFTSRRFTFELLEKKDETNQRVV